MYQDWSDYEKGVVRPEAGNVARVDDAHVELAPGDMLLLRTGSLERFREVGSAAFFADYSEPGLSYDEKLFEWIDAHELLGIGTDTLANEPPRDPATRGARSTRCSSNDSPCPRSFALAFHLPRRASCGWALPVP